MRATARGETIPTTSTSERPRVRHRFFAPILARIMQSGEEHGQTDLRRETLAGRVIELGAGTGLNFPHYPADRIAASHVIGRARRPAERE
jgi:hypothetical protein